MQKNKRREQELFLENISRKVWMQLSYANAVEQSLYEGSLRHLILEEIDKKELQKLEDMAKTASADIDDMIADASSLGFEKTVKYLGKLKKKLPGNLSLVKLVLKGDAQEAAKEIGKVTSTTTTVNNIRDSFYDAVVLFGSELAKLPYAQDPESAASEAATAAAEESESGEVEVADGKTVSPEEATKQAVAAFKEQPIEDIASNKFMTWAKGIKFPDSGMLQKAAQNSYKEPPKPKGFLGKVASFFGFGDLTAEDFADDLMSAKLSDIIEKSKELSAKRAEAQKEEEAAQALAGELSDDVQALAQGDSSALAVAAGQGGSTGADTGGAATVQMTGVGSVPASALPQVMPGQRIDSPDDTKGKDMVSMDDLERKVTAPEDVAQMTDELAALINDDPKSDVVFFSEKEAEEAAEDQPPPLPDEEDKTKKEWVYKNPLSTMLFESSHRRTISEAIMYKDVEKAIVDQGVKQDKVEALAVNLADRLKNQYDVVITGMPTEDVQQASQAAAGQSDQLDKFLGYLEKRDTQAQQQFDRYMDDVGMSRKDTMEFTQAVADGNMKLAQRVAKDAGVSAQKAFDTAAEMGAEFELEIEDEEASASSTSSDEEASSSASSKEKSEEESQSAETSDTEETKEKKTRVSGPPTDKMKERGESVGVKAKEGESGQAYGARVRKEEEKQGKRVRKTKTTADKKSSEKTDTAQSSAKKSEKAKSSASKSGKKKVKARGRAAIAAAQGAGFGRFSTNENAYYRPATGKLTEALLGPNPGKKLPLKDDDDVSQRWRQLAGLEEK
jgi:uncharacterized protein (UPF0335 family)